MPTLRTKFKKEIIAAFLPPRRPSNKAVILLRGLPSGPRHEYVLEFFAKKGYWAFYPSYRGTWESGGRFLDHSPEKDILDLIGELPRGFKDLRSGRRYQPKLERIYVVGASFSGPAAILLTRDPRVTKAVAISPVVDWRAQKRSKAESMGVLGKFVREGFGGVYRFQPRDWQRLSRGTFYNPVQCTDEFDAPKLFIIHAKDDRVVPVGPTARFAKKVGCSFLMVKHGGHFGLGSAIMPRFYPHISRFFAQKSS